MSRAARPAGTTDRCLASKDAIDAAKNLPDSDPVLWHGEARSVHYDGVGLGWRRRTRVAKNENTKQTRVVDFAVPDLRDRVRIRGHSARPRSVLRRIQGTYLGTN
jgi:hypothetical protein